MARRGGGGYHSNNTNTVVGSYRRQQTVNNFLNFKFILFCIGFFVFFLIIYTVIISGMWFFSTPFGQKTMVVSATLFTFIYTYTYPLWWVLGKIWNQIRCVILWICMYVIYPVGETIYWVFT